MGRGGETLVQRFFNWGWGAGTPKLRKGVPKERGSSGAAIAPSLLREALLGM